MKIWKGTRHSINQYQLTKSMNKISKQNQELKEGLIAINLNSL